MSFRQIITLAITGLFIVGIGTRSYGLVKERNAALRDLRTIQDKAKTVEEDRLRIESESRFLADPDNLEKELRERFNYHAPGEREIIIVPPQNPTSTTSTELEP